MSEENIKDLSEKPKTRRGKRSVKKEEVSVEPTKQKPVNSVKKRQTAKQKPVIVEYNNLYYLEGDLSDIPSDLFGYFGIRDSLIKKLEENKIDYEVKI